MNNYKQKENSNTAKYIEFEFGIYIYIYISLFFLQNVNMNVHFCTCLCLQWYADIDMSVKASGSDCKIFILNANSSRTQMQNSILPMNSIIDDSHFDHCTIELSVHSFTSCPRCSLRVGGGCLVVAKSPNITNSSANGRHDRDSHMLSAIFIRAILLSWSAAFAKWLVWMAVTQLCPQQRWR